MDECGRELYVLPSVRQRQRRHQCQWQWQRVYFVRNTSSEQQHAHTTISTKSHRNATWRRTMHNGIGLHIYMLCIYVDWSVGRLTGIADSHLSHRSHHTTCVVEWLALRVVCASAVLLFLAGSARESIVLSYRRPSCVSALRSQHRIELCVWFIIRV